MPDKRQQLVEFVRQRVVLVGSAPVFLGHQVQARVGLRAPDGSVIWFENAQSLSEALVNDAEFRIIELGTWLNTPDGALVAEAVAQVLPPGPEYELLVDGIMLAANRLRTAGWHRAIGAAVADALVAVGQGVVGNGRQESRRTS